MADSQLVARGQLVTWRKDCFHRVELRTKKDVLSVQDGPMIHASFGLKWANIEFLP